jgi:phosphoribosylformylglycinamidine (FGAM) synthase-like amidotransferase family enzyme
MAKGSGCSIPQTRKPKLTANETTQANNKMSHLEVNTKEKLFTMHYVDLLV